MASLGGFRNTLITRRNSLSGGMYSPEKVNFKDVLFDKDSVSIRLIIDIILMRSLHEFVSLI